MPEDARSTRLRKLPIWLAGTAASCLASAAAAQTVPYSDVETASRESDMVAQP